MRRSCAALRAIAGERALDERRLDQLFAEPIVQQLMYRDRVDEAKNPPFVATGGRRSSGAAGREVACPRGWLPFASQIA
jgi:hypothetical protein